MYNIHPYTGLPQGGEQEVQKRVKNTVSEHSATHVAKKKSEHKTRAHAAPEREREEQEATQETHRKKKARRRSFPAAGLILTLVLIAVIAAGAWFGIQYFQKLEALKARYADLSEKLSAQLVEEQQALRLADPDNETHTAEREMLRDALLQNAQEELDRVEEENRALDGEIAEQEALIREYEQQEDFDYYRSIYDTYKEGRDYVENLLSGD